MTIHRTLSKYFILEDSDLFDMDVLEGVKRTFEDTATGFAARHFENIDEYRQWKWFNGLDREGLGVDTGDHLGGDYD